MIIYEDILRDFHKQKVKYVVVGGIAFNLHGALRKMNVTPGRQVDEHDVAEL